MLGDHPVCFGHGVRAAIRKRGVDHLIADIVPELQRYDLVFGNLECVISEVGGDDGSLEKSEMRADRSSVQLLRKCGFNVISVSNNHMLQHGPESFDETVGLLSSAGIRPVGLRDGVRSNEVVCRIGDESIILISHSLRAENYARTNASYASGSSLEILEQVRSTKAQFRTSLLVVSLHWGEEYMHAPSAEQIEFAHQLVDSGAGLVLGHHPHVLQGIEMYGQGLIAFSLGNFLFDSWQRPTRESMILSCSIADGRVVEYSVIPIEIGSDFVIRKLKGADKARLLARIEEFSADVIERKGLAAETPERYRSMAEKAYLRYRLECYWYFITHLWRYDASVLFASLRRAFFRRIGLA